MKKSILNDKRVLVVNNQPAVLTALEEEILRVAPNCDVDKATDYKNAVILFVAYTYDLIILDSLSSCNSDFLSLTVIRFPPTPVVLLTNGYLDPGVLKGFLKMGARICPSEKNFGQIIPFLEGVVRYENFPGWRRLLEAIGRIFSIPVGDRIGRCLRRNSGRRLTRKPLKTKSEPFDFPA